MADRVLDVHDVSKILNRSQDFSYKLIRKLNHELEEDGYLISGGRIPAKYFYKRIGLEYEEN